ncbi:MAG: flagellar biosynthesis protein FliQ [Defluviitaleaceae bacterium]|nr:flagellar biosynthesis protein FliQ [Defluviitaleaceae bacterium]
MSQQIILDIIREGLLTVILVAMPPLIMGLVAGLVMAVFQTVTSIQEPTLAFIPKIIAVLLAIVIFGPFMLNQVTQYFINLTQNFNYFIHPALFGG